MSRTSLVAIDTVPLPEKPAFQFERFLVDKLAEAKVIDAKAEPLTRFNLALDALRQAEKVGYVVDYPHVCLTDNPPEWCKYAGALRTEGRILLIDTLLESGAIKQSSWPSWRAMAAKLDLASFAPRLFQEIGLKPERSIEILDKASVASLAMPVPGSDLEKYCREHPETPRCQLASSPLESLSGQRLASELVMISMLHQDNLLQDDQASAIYNGYYNDLSGGLALRDISIHAGVVVIDGLSVDAKLKARILVSVGKRLGSVGYIDPDSPLASICFGPNPPKFCWAISQFPAAAALTSELVSHQIWPKDDALKAWTEAAVILSREPFPVTDVRDPRLGKPAPRSGDAAVLGTVEVP
jgi:hypothetical protein